MKLGSTLKVFLILLLLGAGLLGLYIYRPTLTKLSESPLKSASPAAQFNPPKAVEPGRP